MALSARVPDLAALEVLLSVARTGSLGRAAQEAGVSQQAVSARIRAMEAQTGVTLVQRTARGSSLTAEGAVIAQWAARVARRRGRARRRDRGAAQGPAQPAAAVRQPHHRRAAAAGLAGVLPRRRPRPRQRGCRDHPDRGQHRRRHHARDRRRRRSRVHREPERPAIAAQPGHRARPARRRRPARPSLGPPASAGQRDRAGRHPAGQPGRRLRDQPDPDRRAGRRDRRGRRAGPGRPVGVHHRGGPRGRAGRAPRPPSSPSSPWPTTSRPAASPGSRYPSWT